MLPANFQIHLDYSLEQRFMVEFMSESEAHRRKRRGARVYNRYSGNKVFCKRAEGTITQL